MLADLNGHLQVPGNNGRFIAMAYSVYDPGARRLTVANAGFPQPLLVRSRRAAPIEVGGVPLGLLPESEYEAASLELRPGDAVIFCSDGIYEQTDPHEEEFGLERLLARVAAICGDAPAAEVAELIVEAIREHAGNTTAAADHRDDCTVVVLRINP
jgi:serine phosphatase RsbU (regulator of sigma subunit)